MNDLQPQHPFKRIEVAVTMEQRILLEDAERRDPAINRLANCETLAAEVSKTDGSAIAWPSAEGVAASSRALGLA